MMMNAFYTWRCQGKSYGSCNSPERCYIIGVRQDIFKQDLLDQMVAFVEQECPTVHPLSESRDMPVPLAMT